MNLTDHPEADEKACWLSRDEINTLDRQINDVQKEIAFGLMVRAGLRSAEVTALTPSDLSHTPAGKWMATVRDGKGGKTRQTPVPTGVAGMARAYADDDTNPVVDVSTRTLRRWVERAAEDAREETGDPNWSYLSPHDLRKTWAQQMIQANVEVGLILEYGGWESWDYFRDHYLGQFSIEHQESEMEKVYWL